MKTTTLILVLAAAPLLGCKTQIHHGLEEREANEIVSALVSRGYEAQKVPEKGKKPVFAIEVADANATDAMRVLTELKLPRPPRTTTHALALVQGLIDTPSAEKLRQFEALEGDIETALEGMDGVTTASVELVVPPPSRPGQEAAKSKAGVLLRVSPEAYDRLDTNAVRDKLRALVAGSAEGLAASDVTLVIDRVQTQVHPPIKEATSPELLRTRGLVVALSLSVLLLTGVILVLLRRPRLTRPERKATPEPTPTKPAPSPSSTDLPRRVTPTKPMGAQTPRKAA